MNFCLAMILAVLALAAPLAAQPVADPTDLDMDGEPGVAALPENPNPAAPSILVGTGTLLIDRSHQNGFDVSGFTNFLVSNGWTVSEFFSGPITGEALTEIDVFLVPARLGTGPILPYSPSEVDAIEAFLATGGGLWVLNDNKDPTGVNTLSQAFGVTFQYDFVRDPSNNEGQLFWPTIHLLAEHPLTSNVTSYGYYSGDCLSVSAPAQVIARADEDSYSLFCPVGSMPPTLAVWQEQGRAVFAGDQTPLHPSYYPSLLREEEQLLLQNIANWLLGPPPNAVEAETWGTVKARFR